MNWFEVVMITFSCVAANHLGLVGGMEKTLKHRLPILNCVKCFTFWVLLAYGCIIGENVFVMIATSFLFSWLAIWLDLGMGMVDHLYLKAYETIYSTADTTAADSFDPDDTLSCVPEESE